MFDSTVVETQYAMTRPIEYGLLINAETLGSQHILVSDVMFDCLCKQVREDTNGNVDLIEQGFRHFVATIVNGVNAGQVLDPKLIMMTISFGAVLVSSIPAPQDRTYLLRIRLDGHHEFLRMDESIQEALNTSEGAWDLWHRTQEMVDLAGSETKGSV
jgi:hypothetical protein